jgi:hypothetical protein
MFVWFFSSTGGVFAFTGELGKTDYKFPMEDIFPTPRNIKTDQGIDNIREYIVAMIPFLTTLMAVWAVLMVIFWGFNMVMGGADSEQTEKGKGIIKDALIGILVGLLAYVIITTLWNILDI